MQIQNTQNQFGVIAKLLHWLMALLLIGLVILGLTMVEMPLGIKKLKMYGWHKEWGVLVLMLVCIRLIWRLFNTTPPLPNNMPLWQKFAATSIHWVFYFLMFALPITGWMLSSASGLPVSFFGLFVLPDLVAQSDQLRSLLSEVHKWLAYGLIAAFFAHSGAALQHHFIHKDDILRRMLP